MSDNTPELKSELEDIEEEEEEELDIEDVVAKEPDELSEEESDFLKEKQEELSEENKEKFKEVLSKEKGGGGEQFTMPDKFKGKTTEEVAKSYVEMEKMIEKKAQEKAEKIAKEEKGKIEGKEKEEKEEKKIKPPIIDGKPDFSKMDPNQFVQFILQEIDRKAEEKARKIYESSSNIRDTIKSEVREARKDHPLLKVNKEYTDLVVALVSSAAAEGKTISLKEACKKVDAFKGGKSKEKISKEEEERLKKAKAEVETGAGAGDDKGKDTEEERIKKGMLRQSQTGDLGGL